MNSDLNEELAKEEVALNHMLIGKSIARVFRNRCGEICIQFEGGTRLFIDAKERDTLEFSVTES